MRTWFVLVIALWAGCAWSQWNTQRAALGSQTGARSVTLTPGEMVTELLSNQTYRPKSQSLLEELLEGRTYIPGPAGSGNGTVIDGLRNGPGPAGQLPFKATRSVTWAATAKAASRALPIVGTALVVKDLYDEIRCREAFGGGPECDEGLPQVPGTVFTHPFLPGQSFPSLAEAAAALAGHLAVTQTSGGQYTNYRVVSCDGTNNRCRIERFNNFNPGAGWELYGNVQFGTVTGLQCPQLTAPDGSLYRPALGRDGRCPSGVFEDVPYTDVEDKIRNHGDKARAPALWPVLDQAGIPIEHPTPGTLGGPDTVQGGRETTSNPDGSTRTRDTEHPITYGPEGYRWQDRVIDRTWPPGVTPTPPGTPPSEGTPPATTTEGGSQPAPLEVITCGLPGKPPCKIDESGTPTGQGVETSPGAAIEALGTAQVGLITSGQAQALPWLWSLQLPAGSCSALDWSVQGRTISFDICSAWLVEFWRALLAWVFGIWASIYVWRTATNTTGGN